MAIRVFINKHLVCVTLDYETMDLGDKLVELGAHRSYSTYNQQYLIAQEALPQLRELLTTHAMAIEDNGLLDLPPFIDPPVDLFQFWEAIPLMRKHSRILGSQPSWGDDRDRLVSMFDAIPEILTAIGYKVETQASYRNEPSRYLRFTTSKASEFLGTLFSEFHKVFTAEVTEEGLREQFTVEQFLTFFEEARLEACGPTPKSEYEKWYPTNKGAYLTALLSRLPDISRDEDTIFILNKPWPLRIGTKFSQVEVDGAFMQLASWACHQGLPGDSGGSILHFSAIGSEQKNRGLWAKFMGGAREWIEFSKPGYRNSDRILARRMAGKGTLYTIDWNATPLPKSQMTHMVITHRSDSEPKAGESFLHLVGDHFSGSPDITRFFYQLDKALTIPVRAEWANELWKYGVKFGLIQKMPSFNCTAYWVEVKERHWTKIIQGIVLGVDPQKVEAVVEKIGKDVEDMTDLTLEHDDDIVGIEEAESE
jgi:hypothetical protein